MQVKNMNKIAVSTIFCSSIKIYKLLNWIFRFDEYSSHLAFKGIDSGSEI